MNVISALTIGVGAVAAILIVAALVVPEPPAGDPPGDGWIRSGPFEIDGDRYVLGQKIFVRIDGLGPEERGQMSFLRQDNDTHHTVYTTVPFDGAQKPSFNHYVEPQLSRVRGLCSAGDIAGQWRIVFEGTGHPDIAFEILNRTLPGAEDSFGPVC